MTQIRNIRENSAFFLPLPKTPIICTTDGKGWWSDTEREVEISNVKISISEVEFYLSTLKPSLVVYVDAHFTKNEWNVGEHGLIYTDERWLREFRSQMKKHFPHLFPAPVEYTEQGMQGDDYVSMEIVLNSIPKIKAFDLGLGKLGKKLKWMRYEDTKFAEWNEWKKY